MFDFCFYLVPAALILVVFAALKVEPFTVRSYTFFELAIVLLLFAWTAIPFVYAFSFAFTSAPKGYTIIVLFNTVTGLQFNTPLAVGVLLNTLIFRNRRRHRDSNYSSDIRRKLSIFVGAHTHIFVSNLQFEQQFQQNLFERLLSHSMQTNRLYKRSAW